MTDISYLVQYENLSLPFLMYKNNDMEMYDCEQKNFFRSDIKELKTKEKFYTTQEVIEIFAFEAMDLYDQIHNTDIFKELSENGIKDE